MRRALEVGRAGGEHFLVRTTEDLDQLLDSLDAEARSEGRPQSIEMTADDGAGTLSIVVGDDRSALHHVPEHLDPPYLASRGDEDDDRVFTFYVGGNHHTEAPWRDTIPKATARAAAREFLLSGRLDDRIRWEEV